MKGEGGDSGRRWGAGGESDGGGMTLGQRGRYVLYLACLACRYAQRYLYYYYLAR